MSNAQFFRNIVEQRKGRKLQIEADLLNAKTMRNSAKRSLRDHEQARVIVREVGMETQKQLAFHISDVTSLALESVFDNAYELKVDFVERRNTTECDLLFVREDEEMHPISASGGGAVDVAAFALRVASWSMKLPRYRNVIILDEPFRFLSKDLQDKASEMIKQVSKKLGIQFIIITHESVLGLYADKVFEVTIKNGISKVK